MEVVRIVEEATPSRTLRRIHLSFAALKLA